MTTRGSGKTAGAEGGVVQSRAYVLLVLTMLSAFSHLDRQLIAIVLEPVRSEFALSDVQLGLLSGLAFAAIYTTLGIPAALWAARGQRIRLISVAAAFWGTMTMVTGAAQSFVHLLVARIGVGIGESGFLPAAHAVVSALYRSGERATALATLSAGVNVGVFLAFLVGGVISQFYGWRLAFAVAGLATLAAAVLLWATVKEPARADTDSTSAPPSGEAIRTTLRAMRRDTVMFHLVMGAMLTSTVSYGALTWLPSFLLRSHGLSLSQAGIYLALVLGLGGAVGTWLGGYASDKLGARDIRWSLWFVGLAYVVTKPLSAAFFLVDGTTLALLLFLLPGMTGAIFVGPSVSVLHERVDEAHRPIASAILIFLTSFIGVGLGPLIVGALSQFTFASAGEDSLAYALAVMQIGGLWGGWHYWRAGKALRG